MATQLTDAERQYRRQNTGKIAAGAGAGALSGAASGAMIGSTLGPVGTAVGGVVGGVAGAIAGGLKAAPGKAERENARRLRELEEKRARGELGLTDAEERLMQARLMDPVRRQVSQLGTMAPSGEESFAEQAALRKGAAQATSQAATGARFDIEGKDIEKQRLEEQELEQRAATTDAYGQARKEAIMADLADAASTAGKWAGQPGMSSIWGKGGMTGEKVEQFFLDELGPTNAKVLRDWAERDPKAFEKWFAEQTAQVEGGS